MDICDTSPLDATAAYVNAQLAALAGQLVGGGQSISGLRRLTGGASLETWAFDVEHQGGARALILRRRGSGDDSDVFETSLDLGIEAKVLAAAARSNVPVAALVRDCQASDGLGEAYIVERVEGETLGRRIAAGPAFEAVRPSMAAQCGQTLARIHSVPTDALPPLQTQSAQDVLDRYVAIYRKFSAPRPVLEAALCWMRERLPHSVEPRLVHGDFRNGNLMVHPEKGLVAALDWELAHLGDPAEDIGWLCVNSWRFGVVEKPVGGFGDLHDLLAAYAQAGGEELPVERVRFWQAAGTFKWAVVTMMMYQTFASGGSASVERAVIGRRLSECEVDLLALMEGGQ